MPMEIHHPRILVDFGYEIWQSYYYGSTGVLGFGFDGLSRWNLGGQPSALTREVEPCRIARPTGSTGKSTDHCIPFGEASLPRDDSQKG